MSFRSKLDMFGLEFVLRRGYATEVQLTRTSVVARSGPPEALPTKMGNSLWKRQVDLRFGILVRTTFVQLRNWNAVYRLGAQHDGAELRSRTFFTQIE